MATKTSDIIRIICKLIIHIHVSDEIISANTCTCMLAKAYTLITSCFAAKLQKKKNTVKTIKNGTPKIISVSFLKMK